VVHLIRVMEEELVLTLLVEQEWQIVEAVEEGQEP
jgi:hypothetical protein